jgi:ankyrin repeat protein
MKHLLLTTIAAVLLVGCGESQQVTVQAPDISIQDAAKEGNIKAIKQHIAAGTDVNAKGDGESTPLHWAAYGGHKEIAELFIAKGADVNAIGIPIRKLGVNYLGRPRKTPLDVATMSSHTETADLLRKHGGKTAEELKAEGK